MKTIKCQFKSNGKTVKKVAILKDDLQKLSTSRKNECYEVSSEEWDDGIWSLLFEETPGILYEVQLAFDTGNRQKTLRPIKAITWEEDIITDVQEVKVTIR